MNNSKQRTNRWFTLFVLGASAGLMIFVPYLRYNYYDQMLLAFSITNTQLGILGSIYGFGCTISYLFIGFLADSFNPKFLLTISCGAMSLLTFWYASLPSFHILIIISILFCIASVLMFWASFNVVVRSLGKDDEQGRMFGFAECSKGVINVLIGFLSLWIMGLSAGTKGFQYMLFFNAAVFGVWSILIFITVPSIFPNKSTAFSGNTSSLKENYISALKTPGTWIVAALLFFAYSFYSASSGYLGAYQTSVLGISPETASSLAIIRNYVIMVIATLLVGFIADKIGSCSKTQGILLACATVCAIVLLLTKDQTALSIVISFFLAYCYLSMRGLYLAPMAEVGINAKDTAMAVGFISLIGYLPDAFFAIIAGHWLDQYGNKGFDYIFYYMIISGILGFLTAWIAYRYSKKLEKTEYKKPF